MANSTIWTGDASTEQKPVTIHVGDTIRVHYKLIEHEKVAGKTKREVKEETRERVQVFEGIVLAFKGADVNRMMTVRHMGAAAVGVERIFPLASPWIRKIEVKKHGEVRRAKLYYLRGRQGKSATRISEAAVKTTATA